MSRLQRGEAWYRSRIAAGHDDWTLAPGVRGHRRLPELDEVDWLPLDVLNGVPDPEADTEEQALHLLDVEEMRGTIEKLCERERRVLRWRYDDDLTYEEIGRRLNPGWPYSRERIRQIVGATENRICDWLGVPRIHGGGRA